jgi:hypothetical protein
MKATATRWLSISSITISSAFIRAWKSPRHTHKTVNHSANEYVRAKVWHTNTVENYFSILKRGIIGTYHRVSEQHLHRYLAEFDFRYNNRIARGVDDETRAAKMVEGVVNKRLTYRTTAD